MLTRLSEVPKDQPREPFQLELTNGTQITFMDPKQLHWTVLSQLDNQQPAQQIATIVGGAENYQKFSEDPAVTGDVLEKVMKMWRDHYGMGSPGE